MAASSQKTLILLVFIFLFILLFFSLARLFFTTFLGVGMPMNSFMALPNFIIWVLPFFLLILWICILIWVYRDAEERNMNGILWALLVLVGNFVGLLIFLIVRNDEAYRISQSGDSRACQNCGTLVSDKFAFCQNCGTNLKLNCPSCDQSVSADWRVCPHCGEKLVKE